MYMHNCKGSPSSGTARGNLGVSLEVPAHAMTADPGAPLALPQARAQLRGPKPFEIDWFLVRIKSFRCWF